MMAAPQDVLGAYIPPPKNVTYADQFGGPAYGQRAAGWVTDDAGNYTHTPGAAEEDVARFRQMGARRTSPVWLNTTQSDQSRGLQYGSLASMGAAAAGNTADMRYLADAASGTTPSRAEILGNQMADRSLRSQVAAAGSVRGGPAATAASYRSAAQNAAVQRADMARGIQAERAGELDRSRTSFAGAMGAARRDFSGAASAVRGQDIQTASTQAELEARERAAQRQQEQYYEEMGFRTRVEDLRARQGNMGAQDAERRWLRTTQNAEEQADFNRVKDTAGMASGAVTGGIGAYSNMAQADYYNRKTDTSDVRSKEPLQWGSLAPVTWGAKAKVGATDREDRDTGGNENHVASDPYEQTGMPDDGHAYKEGGAIRANPYVTAPSTWSTSQIDDPEIYNDGIIHADPYMTSDTRAKEEAFKAGQRSVWEYLPDTTGAEEFFRDALPPSPEMAKKLAEQPWRERNKPETVGGGKKLATTSAPDRGDQAYKPLPAPFSTPRPQYTESVGPEHEKPYSRAPSLPDQIRWDEVRGQDMDPAIAAAYLSLGPPKGSSPTASIKTSGSRSVTGGRKRDIANSDERTKTKAKTPDVVPLSDDPEQGRLQMDGEHAFYKRDEPADDGRPSLAGASAPPHLEPRSAPSSGPAASKPAYRKKTPEELMAEADQMMQGMKSDHNARMSAGPAVKADAEMADAMRTMSPGVYAYKPEFTPPEQKPGEVNIGPMANNMAKDNVAGTAIVTNPETGMLAIDKDKGLKLVMGSLASLQHQLDTMRRPRRGGPAEP